MTDSPTMQILKRIGEQYEFSEAWKKMENVERSYLAGDIYNVISSAISEHNKAVIKELERHASECAGFEEEDWYDHVISLIKNGVKK